MTAEEICRNVDSRIRPQVITLAEQVLFMADKLTETVDRIHEQALAIPYDNGGGQTGIRENPEFVAYEKMVSLYAKSLSSLSGVIGENAAEETDSLEGMRNRFKVIGG